MCMDGLCLKFISKKFSDFFKNIKHFYIKIFLHGNEGQGEINLKEKKNVERH